MTLVTHRNNRSVLTAIMVMCMLGFYLLLNPAIQYPKVLPKLKTPNLIGVNDILDDPHLVDAPVPTVLPKEHDHSNSQHSAHVPAEHDDDDDDDDDGGDGAGGDGAGANGNGNGDKLKTATPPPLTSDDVLLIVKTGGTTMWRRMLVHLSTSLARERIRRNNTVIYSDLVETIGDFTTVDALANLSNAAKSRPDFDAYRQQSEYRAYNRYLESTGVEGDDRGPVGGWGLDKYKLVPLVQHAGREWPRARWYVYMEDDTYLFLPNVLAYLSRFDWREPHYLGSYTAKSEVVFAHGGAGFALSRGAWEKAFGGGANDDRHVAYAEEHCCGDQVLAHVLGQHGVQFGERGGGRGRGRGGGGGGRFDWGFNPSVHWNFGFDRFNWCSPLMSWHRVHNRDVAEYFELEKRWNFTESPLLHRDFFSEMILPRIKKRLEWWDNMSNLYEVTSVSNKEGPPGPPDGYSSAAWKKAWKSPDACEKACRSWRSCVQWSYVEDRCRMDNRMTMGQGYAPSMSERKTAPKQTSGWLPDRLSEWACKVE